MLFAATTTGDLMASIGTISTDLITSALPYVLVAVGIPLGFYIIKRLIGLMPKGR